MKKTIKNIQTILIYTNIFLVLSIFSLSANYINAQHHGAPPPFATVGDRNIKMNFVTQPTTIVAGQDSQLKMSLVDTKTGATVQHVTYRLTIDKDNQTKVSEFFHSHNGNLTIASRNSNSPTINVEGTFDDMTNAYVPDDPSGTIDVSGPLFSQPGLYKANVEVTTIDNDKTDLSVPLKYQFDINVKK
jgi:hypothetical protein